MTSEIQVFQTGFLYFSPIFLTSKLEADESTIVVQHLPCFYVFASSCFFISFIKRIEKLVSGLLLWFWLVYVIGVAS